MANMNGYKSIKKSDQGLGLGGNPRLNQRPEAITDNMDSNQADNVEFKADSTYGKDELVVSPREAIEQQPRELTVEEFLNMMEKGE
jgi:hypothetical protein